MKARAALLATLPLAGCLPAESAPLDLSPSYRVVRVADGDTLTVRRDGRDVTVRLIGVDAPETVHPSKPPQCHGREASAFTKRLAGQQIRLERDATTDRTDRYGRELVYVVHNGQLVNRQLLERGLARENGYGDPYRREAEFEAAERAAKGARAGLWGAC